MQKYIFFFTRFSSKLSIRAASFAALAMIATLSAMLLAPIVPEQWATLLGTEAVDNILKIIASSMLVVVTFSLSTMVSAYSAASQSVSPRAARLLIEDNRSQNALSIFLGSFIFSIVSIIALATQYYGSKERFILFIFTIILIIGIVGTIISWIETLSKLGRVHETIAQIEKATLKPLKKLATHPLFCCMPLKNDDNGKKIDLHLNDQGYLQTIDFQTLQSLADENDFLIEIEKEPGSFIHHKQCIARILKFKSEPKDDLLEDLRECFVTGNYRTFFEDARLGFVILAEVASRALSPAVNDPGTAIDVVTSMERLLSQWIEHKEEKAPPKFNRIFMKTFDPSLFFEDILYPISRDGAKNLELISKVLKALKGFENSSDKILSEASFKFQKIVVNRAQESLVHADERTYLSSLTKG